jgi:hypothetical protein
MLNKEELIMGIDELIKLCKEYQEHYGKRKIIDIMYQSHQK